MLFTKFKGKDKKQSSGGVLSKRFSWKFRKTHSKTFVLEFLRASNNIGMRPYHGCFCILWVLQNFQNSFLAECLLATISDMTLFFFSKRMKAVCSLKTTCLVGQCYMRRRNLHTLFILCSYRNQAEASLTQWLLQLIQRKRKSVKCIFTIFKDY